MTSSQTMSSIWRPYQRIYATAYLQSKEDCFHTTNWRVKTNFLGDKGVRWNFLYLAHTHEYGAWAHIFFMKMETIFLHFRMTSHEKSRWRSWWVSRHDVVKEVFKTGFPKLKQNIWREKWMHACDLRDNLQSCFKPDMRNKTRVSNLMKDQYFETWQDTQGGLILFLSSIDDDCDSFCAESIWMKDRVYQKLFIDPKAISINKIMGFGRPFQKLVINGT